MSNNNSNNNTPHRTSNFLRSHLNDTYKDIKDTYIQLVNDGEDVRAMQYIRDKMAQAKKDAMNLRKASASVRNYKIETDKAEFNAKELTSKRRRGIYF